MQKILLKSGCHYIFLRGFATIGFTTGPNELNKLSKSNSVSQFFVPGKGEFTLELQDRDRNYTTLEEDVAAYERGDYQTTFELLKSLSTDKNMAEKPKHGLHTFDEDAIQRIINAEPIKIPESNIPSDLDMNQSDRIIRAKKTLESRQWKY